jgi:hypothetical protein
MMAITATWRQKSKVRAPTVLVDRTSAGKSNPETRAEPVAGESRSSGSIHAMLVFSRSVRAFRGDTSAT